MSLSLWQWSEDVTRERFLGGGLAAEWLLGLLTLQLRYDRLSWEDGLERTEDRCSFAQRGGSRMRRPILLVALLAGLLASNAAKAQHPLSDCTMCHGPHDAGSDLYSLRVDDILGSGYRAAIQSTGPGAVSLSCLRCHATPALRVRQARGGNAAPAPAAPPPAGGGKYLDLDPSDDHPLGRAEYSERSEFSGSWLGSRRPRPDAGIGSAGRVAQKLS
jgi:hypothetical protein